MACTSPRSTRASRRPRWGAARPSSSDPSDGADRRASRPWVGLRRLGDGTSVPGPAPSPSRCPRSTVAGTTPETSRVRAVHGSRHGHRSAVVRAPTRGTRFHPSGTAPTRMDWPSRLGSSEVAFTAAGGWRPDSRSFWLADAKGPTRAREAPGRGVRSSQPQGDDGYRALTSLASTEHGSPRLTGTAGMDPQKIE